MDLSMLTHALLSTQSPALPSPGVAYIYLAVGWGLVLACAAQWLLRRCGVQRALPRWGLSLLLLVWCLWPGAASPVWWLGLAFRAPSLLAVLLCGGVLLAYARPGWPQPADALRRWAPVPVLLGWVLLLDTFAVWPISLYALGGSPLVLAMAAFASCLPWLLRGARVVSVLLAMTLLLHVLLRLPTGNVWDALLDPWLWVWLQADWLLRGLGRWRASRAGRRFSAA